MTIERRGRRDAPFFVCGGIGCLMVINVYVVSSLRGTKQSWFCLVMLAVCHADTDSYR
jgi:hypothetical protein